MDMKLLELFKKEINFPDDHTKVCWYDDGCGTVMFNTDNSVEDLMGGNGNTYSGEIRGASVERSNFVMYELDSGCGWDYQAIFSEALKVDRDKYWDEQ